MSPKERGLRVRRLRARMREQLRRTETREDGRPVLQTILDRWRLCSKQTTQMISLSAQLSDFAASSALRLGNVSLACEGP